MEGKIPGLSLQDCADQRALLDAVLGADGYDTALAMDHGDFKPENIIVDAEYNIQGYVLRSAYGPQCFVLFLRLC
jgi:hypothetical protein